jgi:hypothetical protein
MLGERDSEAERIAGQKMTALNWLLWHVYWLTLFLLGVGREIIGIKQRYEDRKRINED